MPFYIFRRSVRSSYAFAHQEGFGRLITSGKIMRQPPSQPYPAFQVSFSTKQLKRDNALAPIHFKQKLQLKP